MDNETLRQKACGHEFAEAKLRLESALKLRNIPVFARFDHAQNAREAGLELAPCIVFVFGNPKVGTLLMQERPDVALELPLRFLLWKDAMGTVQLAWKDPLMLAREYGLAEGNPTVVAMHDLMESLAQEVCVY